MKGLFNKTLVIALLASVSGISAYQDSKEIVADGILGASIGYSIVGLVDALKNPESGINKSMRAAGSFALQGTRSFGSAIATRARDISAKVTPVLAEKAEALKLVAGKISSDVMSAGSVVKTGAVKAIEASKPVLTASLGYAMRAKDGAKSFYANHTTGCRLAAFLTAYVGFCMYAEYAVKQARMNREMQKRIDAAHEAAQANQVTEATQVDVDELNNHVIA